MRDIDFGAPFPAFGLYRPLITIPSEWAHHDGPPVAYKRLSVHFRIARNGIPLDPLTDCPAHETHLLTILLSDRRGLRGKE